MKVVRFFLLGFGFSSVMGFSQVSFTLPTTVCLNQSITVSANTGTLVSPQLTWLASPNAIFSNSVSPNTTLTFTAAGNYTVLLVATSGTVLAFSQQTIQVNANPSPVLMASSASVCPGSTFSIMASPLSGATYSFGLPGPVTVSNGTSNVLQINPPTVLPAVYEVSVDVGGCVGTSSVTVHQMQLNPQIIASQLNVCIGFNSTLTVFSGGTNYTFSILAPSPTVLATGNTPSIAASPSVPTVYHVLTESLGCTGTTSVSIGISAPISINITASSPTTCIMNNFPKLSKPVTLNPSGAVNYIWDPPLPPSPGPLPGGQLTVYPLQTTCYTVTGMTAVCSGSAAICITVTPQFTVGITPPSASICLGDTLTLLTQIGWGAVGSPSAFTYSWTESSNSPTITMSSYFTPTLLVFPQHLTSYSLEIWDTHTCVSLPQVATVQVDLCVNSREENTPMSIRIGPNPFNEYFDMDVPAGPELELSLFDGHGRLLKQMVLPSGNTEQKLRLDWSDLHPGMYVLRTQSADSATRLFKLLKL